MPCCGRATRQTPCSDPSRSRPLALLEQFQERLARAAGSAAPAGTWADPRRTLGQGDYLGLLLFGLLNPVVESMRGLCAATELRRVQREVCSARVSLGSFSEAQAVVDETLLQKVFRELAAERGTLEADPRLARYRQELIAPSFHCKVKTSR